MRDLVILIVLPYLIYAGFRKPILALGYWLWTSAFNINQLLYGFASAITFNKLFAGLTILSFFISKKKTTFKIESISICIIFFLIVATISNFFLIGNPDIAWERWLLFFKIILFYFFAVAILQEKKHFDIFIWMLVLSIGALASTEGLKFIISGGGHKVQSFLRGISGDNNFFGVMIVTVLPLSYYLIEQTKHKLVKLGLVGVVFLMCIAVVSTYSRGAFIGLAIFIIFFFKNSNKKISWLVLILLTIFLVGLFLPEEWIARMNTIENAEEDSSFMGRVISWKISTLIAMDNFWGGGFRAVENMSVWSNYSLDFSKLDIIPTSEPSLYTFTAAHSIYFQVLGNHGFLGLFLYLLLLTLSYMKVSKIYKVSLKNKLDNWVVTLSKMLKLSLLIYAVSGAAVNVAYFDFLYAILAMIVVLDTKVISYQLSKK